MNFPYPRVAVVSITYGDRWQFLSQVMEATMKDPHVTRMVIVDNGATHPEQIKEGVKVHGDRITVIETGQNLGSAGGFAVGLEYAREIDCDFIFLLDDDSIPESGFVESFVDILKLFPEKKIVLSASRNDVLDNKEYFYKPSILDDSPRGTFFDVFQWKKFFYFSTLLIKGKSGHKRGPFIPIIPTEAFVYGGAFIPIEAVRLAPLPDKELFLYGDDVEYSWNIKKLGYASYLCAIPRLHDVDFSFGENTSHIFGKFDPATPLFKVYYGLRNMVRLSRKHTKQRKIVLFFNILVWTIGLFLLGFIKYGPTTNYFKRVAVMIKAVCAGYFPKSKLATEIESSFFKK